MKRRTAISAVVGSAVFAPVWSALARGESGSVTGSENGVKTPDATAIRGSQRVALEQGSISISSGNDFIDENLAVLSVSNLNSNTCGLRIRAFWHGDQQREYQNNDASLYEVFNRTSSDSRNRSWAVSACNAMHHIPAGVTDSGTRVGVLGWATSINYMGYKHEGTLESQVGVSGRAGFQGPNSGASARILEGVGVRGEVVHDSLVLVSTRN